jgi:hypothetical protein
MLKIGEFFMIRELYQKGWTQTAIAKEIGHLIRIQPHFLEFSVF